MMMLQGLRDVIREFRLANLFDEEYKLSENIKKRRQKGQAVMHLIDQREGVRNAIKGLGYNVQWDEIEPDYCPHGNPWDDCPDCRH
jgi:hypothetical protein